MPIFEYVCDCCQENFEKLVRSEEKISCPKCNSESLTKQFSTFGLSNGSSSGQKYESLPMYKPGGGCCNPGGCGCKN
jgi:putative FmdB family regulatory protein